MYSVAQDIHEDPDKYIEAHQDGKNVGYLRLKPNDDIHHIKVLPKFRRQGIATGLYNEAKRLGHNPQHTENLTPKGRKWKESLEKRMYKMPELAPGEVDEEDIHPETRKWMEERGRTPSDRDTAFAGTRYRRGYTRHADLGRHLGSDRDTIGDRWKRYDKRAKDVSRGRQNKKSAWYEPATHTERTMEENIRQRKGKPYDKELAAEGRRKASEWNAITSGGLQKSFEEMQILRKIHYYPFLGH